MTVIVYDPFRLLEPSFSKFLLSEEHAALQEKMGVLKTSARAYAEDAPAVRQAGELAGKVDKVEAKLEGLDAKCARLRDIDERSARDRARVERLERWRDGEAADALEAVAKAGGLGGGAPQRDVSARVAKVEESTLALRGALAELTPARLGKCEQKLSELQRLVDDRTSDRWS